MAKADGTIIINTKIDTDGIKEGIDNAKKKLNFGDVVKGSAIGSVVADMATNIVSNVKEIGQSFISSAATVKAEGSQFSQTFKDMEDTAREAISGIADESGILDTRLNTLGSQIYAFAKASGGSVSESMQLMESALTVAADSAAYYDRSLEDTTETLQSFLKGNYENDAALGLSATETTRNAKAMELFGEKFNNLTEIQKQQTLLQMVMDAQELSGAMGQAAREADGWENVQGNLNESIRQLQAVAGQPFLAAMVPIVQDLTKEITNLTKNADWEGFSDGVSSLVDSFKKDGFTGLMDTAVEMGVALVNNIANGLAENVTALIDEGLPMLLKFTENLRSNVGTLVDSGINLILQLAKGFADGLPTFFSTIPEIISNIAGIINDNAPKLLVTAGKLILTLLQGLWNALPDLLMSIPDIIIAIVDVFTAFNWLSLGKNIMTFLKDGITSMIGAIKSTAGNVKDGIVNIIKALPGNLKTLASNGINGMINAIRGLIGSVKSAAGQVLTNIVNAITSLPSKLMSLARNAVTNLKNQFLNGGWKGLGKAVIDGIVSGISGAASRLFTNIKNVARNALNAAKRALGIHSPSRAFRDEVGEMLPPGITEGFEGAFPSTIKALNKQVGKMVDSASNVVPSVLEYSMPVMATGTVIPSSVGMDVQQSYLGALSNDIKALKAMLAQRDAANYTSEQMRLVIQLNRRVLYDEFIEEYNLRRLQSGAEPIPV